MLTIQEIRSKYPQYSDLPDDALLKGLHNKHYADMDYGEFAKRVGVVSAPTQQQGQPRAVLEQGLQGATYGFSDELTNRLGALGAVGYSSLKRMFDENYPDISYDDALKEATQLTNQRSSAQQEQYPVTSLVANIGGALLTGGAAGTTAAGKAIGKAAATGGLAARVAKGAAIGGATGGLYGYGTGEEGGRIESAAKGAALGAVAGGIVPAAGAAISGLKNKITGTKPATLSASDIYDRARVAYQEAEKAGGIITPEASDTLLSSLKEVKPRTKAGQLVGGRDEADEVIDALQQLRGSSLTLDDFTEIDQQLSQKIADNFDAAKGGLDSLGNKFLNIQDKFRDYVSNIKSSDLAGGKEGFDVYQRARKLWSRARVMDDIEKVIQKAEFFEQPATAIRVGMRQIAMSPKKLRGFSEEERKLIKKAAQTGFADDLVRTLGSRLPVIGSIFTGSPAAVLAAHAGSSVSRNAASGMQLRKAGKVAEAISNTVQPAMQRSAPSGGIAGSSVAGATPSFFTNGTQNGTNGAMPPPPPSLPKSAPRLQIENRQQPVSPLPPQSSNTSSLLDRIAMVESAGNPNAKATTSSASGLFQFTDGTWGRMVKRYGKELGIRMQDKNNPDAQRRMAEKLTAENTAHLEKKIGREPTDGELYMAHFLGPSGATKLITNYGNGARASTLFPEAAKANRNIFYDRSAKRPRTVEEVYSLLASKVE